MQAQTLSNASQRLSEMFVCMCAAFCGGVRAGGCVCVCVCEGRRKQGHSAVTETNETCICNMITKSAWLCHWTEVSFGRDICTSLHALPVGEWTAGADKEESRVALVKLMIILRATLKSLKNDDMRLFGVCISLKSAAFVLVWGQHVLGLIQRKI